MSSPKHPSHVPSGRRRALAAIAVAVGIPATIVGAGIGVPHALAGLTLSAVVGLLVGALGVFLLVSTLVRAWRRSSWRGRSGLVVASLLVVQFLLFPMSQAVFATNRAPMPLDGRTPADVGLEYRDVRFPAADGIDLSAWYVPSTNGAAVILRHGAGSTKDDVIDHAAVLHEHGYGVLMTDARGHGESGGHAMDFGWYGDADISGAARYLSQVDDVRDGRIGIVGLSMGGEEAIGAAAAIPQLRAVVAEGVTGRRGQDWLALGPAGPGRWASTVFYAIQDATATVLSSAAPPRGLHDAVAALAPRRLLLITAGHVTAERDAAAELREAAPASVTTLDIETAAHTEGLAKAPITWEREVIDFLDGALHPTNQGAQPEGP